MSNKELTLGDVRAIVEKARWEFERQERETASRRAILEVLSDVPIGALIETIELTPMPRIIDDGRAFGVFLDGEWICDWGWKSETRGYADWIDASRSP